MTEKRCSTCHLVRPLGDFNLRASASDGLQARCRQCAREWYLTHKEEHIVNVRLRNNRVRREHHVRLATYLMEHPCVDCGEDDIRVLDFDHEDPSQKLDEVTRLVACSLSWERIEAEIAKCSIRCANCHRRRTAAAGGYWRDRVEEDRRAARSKRAEHRLTSILS